MFFSAWGTIENIQNVEHFTTVTSQPRELMTYTREYIDDYFNKNPHNQRPHIVTPMVINNIINNIKSNPLLKDFKDCNNIDDYNYDLLEFNHKELQFFIQQTKRDDQINSCISKYPLTKLIGPNTSYYAKMQDITRRLHSPDRNTLDIVNNSFYSVSNAYKMCCEKFMKLPQNPEIKNQLMKIGHQLTSSILPFIVYLLRSPPSTLRNKSLSDKLILLVDIKDKLEAISQQLI